MQKYYLVQQEYNPKKKYREKIRSQYTRILSTLKKNEKVHIETQKTILEILNTKGSIP